MKEFVCKTCGKVFYSKKACKGRIPKYCSIECFGKSIRKYKTCAYCGKQFYDWTKDKFCSIECAKKSKIGVPLSEEHKRKLSEGRKASPKCKGSNL